MSGTLFLILALVVFLSGLVARGRVRRAVKDRSAGVSDDLLRSILDEDELRALDDDEPLDEDAIRRAEEEFWEEDSWTDADDWRS